MSAPISQPPSRERAARALIAGAAISMSAAFAGLALGVEAVESWFYTLVWWSYILLADGIVKTRTGRSMLLSRPLAFGLLSLWSAAFWLIFEVVNFRLANWYYVGIPRDLASRSIGVFLAFATVLPGIFETRDLLASLGWFARARCRDWSITRTARRSMTAAGIACLVLPIAFPRTCFPLIWGATVLLAEPWLEARGARGLFSLLSRGECATLLRLLFAGLVCGLLWETWNFAARARWIYTVPFFEDSKLFEMPIAGFLGFPPFALECFTFARLLVALDLMPEWECGGVARREARAGSVRRHAIAAGCALVFSLPATLGVNALTLRATLPMVDEIPGVQPAFVERMSRAGIRSTAQLLSAARSSPPLAGFADLGAEELRRALALARLMEVKSLGARGLAWLLSAGAGTVEDLAAREPIELHRALGQHGRGPEPAPSLAEIKVWVRGALASLERGSP